VDVGEIVGPILVRDRLDCGGFLNGELGELMILEGAMFIREDCDR
jgi:hypothetical protein